MPLLKFQWLAKLSKSILLPLFFCLLIYILKWPECFCFSNFSYLFAGNCDFEEGCTTLEVWPKRKAKVLSFQAIHGMQFFTLLRSAIISHLCVKFNCHAYESFANTLSLSAKVHNNVKAFTCIRIFARK